MAFGRGIDKRCRRRTFRVASVDEVDAEEMQNQTTKDVIRKCSVILSDVLDVKVLCVE
jgi:ribosomal protein L20A (L18A)